MFSQSAFANNHLSRGSVRFVKSLNVYPLFVHLRFKYEKLHECLSYSFIIVFEQRCYAVNTVAPAYGTNFTGIQRPNSPD